MRPSRDLFQAVHHDAAERQHSTTKRDEAAMRSLRSPFEEDNFNSGQVKCSQGAVGVPAAYEARLDQRPGC
jgi:hypothetical protein